MKELSEALARGRGNPVNTRMPESFESLMHFILGVIRERGETTLEDVANVFRHTLWYHEHPEEISFERTFEEDMMEDIPSYERVKKAQGDIRLGKYFLTADGIAGTVRSKEKRYDFEIRIDGLSCECPAAKQWYRGQVCKHLACAIHDLLFDERIQKEKRDIHMRAVYLCSHRFGKTLDIGTKLKQAVEVLCYWGMLDKLPGGAYSTTPAGEIAADTAWDLLLIRAVAESVRELKKNPDPMKLSLRIVEEFRGTNEEGKRWKQAVKQWIGETDIKKIKLPTKFRGDFDNGLEELARIARLYATMAKRNGRSDVADSARQASGCLLYGVAPELIPLRALRFRELGRVRARFLHDKMGIRNLDDLAAADPEKIAGRNLPVRFAWEWVKQATAIKTQRDKAEQAEPQERESLMDEVVNRFRVDPATLGV